MQELGCHHPNIWKFITALKKEQGLVEVKQAKFIAGTKPTKRRKSKNKELDMRELVMGYLHRPKIEFLRGVAHQIGMQTH